MLLHICTISVYLYVFSQNLVQFVDGGYSIKNESSEEYVQHVT